MDIPADRNTPSDAQAGTCVVNREAYLLLSLQTLFTSEQHNAQHVACHLQVRGENVIHVQESVEYVL